MIFDLQLPLLVLSRKYHITVVPFRLPFTPSPGKPHLTDLHLWQNFKVNCEKDRTGADYLAGILISAVTQHAYHWHHCFILVAPLALVINLFLFTFFLQPASTPLMSAHLNVCFPATARLNRHCTLLTDAPMPAAKSKASGLRRQTDVSCP